MPVQYAYFLVQYVYCTGIIIASFSNCLTAHTQDQSNSTHTQSAVYIMQSRYVQPGLLKLRKGLPVEVSHYAIELLFFIPVPGLMFTVTLPIEQFPNKFAKAGTVVAGVAGGTALLGSFS